MSAIETLKQAAQALRDTKPELAAALEAMAETQPVGQVFTEAERLRCDLRVGPCIWFGVPAPGALLYAAPIATPEHDAKVRNADDVNRYLTALRRELELIESDPGSTLSDGARRTIRWATRNADALKSTGATS